MVYGSGGRKRVRRGQVGYCGGGEVDVVAHRVELGIGLDVFCELDWRGQLAKRNRGMEAYLYLLLLLRRPSKCAC